MFYFVVGVHHIVTNVCCVFGVHHVATNVHHVVDVHYVVANVHRGAHHVVIGVHFC